MKDWRINRFLAAAGLGSRRSVERLVREGRIQINDRVVSGLEQRVQTGDRVSCNGQVVAWPQQSRLIALNKPPGYVVSRRPQGGDRSVYLLLPESLHSLAYGGRLDRESRGLLLFSNDGELLQRSAHPSGGVEKRYLVRASLPRGLSPAQMLRQLRDGVRDQGELLQAAKVELCEDGRFRLSLHGGRKRQIRRMFAAAGAPVLDLYRYAVGNLSLEELRLPEGRWTDAAIDAI
ncbi:MAG: hypothetical protein K1X75_08545 [Leptospirales bacterium]|nr:hypothetical protein [Leptospirales bacterium]